MKIYCFTCRKPITDEFPDNMIIFRGTAECPECAEKTKYEKKAIKFELINAFNSLSKWVRNTQKNLNLSRAQIKYILTDKLNDMSKTDVWLDQ